MKKNYYFLCASAVLLMTTSSCSQEENLTSSSSKNSTTLNIVLDNGKTQSRSGEGTEAKELYYEVWQDTEKVHDNYSTEGTKDEVVLIEDGKAAVELPLMKGETYKIVFWAQSPDNSIYNPLDLTNIGVDYSQANANQEVYDAFFYGNEAFVITKNEETIELRRPFGQLNIGTTTTDWQRAKNAIKLSDENDKPVTKSEITVEGLANKFNALSGVASIEGEANATTFQASALINETFMVKNGDKETEYQSLGMNYLLVPSSIGESGNIHKDNLYLSATFHRHDKKLFSIDLPNIPVQRNWRTNIIGELLATDKTFEVVIVPDFNDETKDIPYALINAAANGGTVTLNEDVVLHTTLNVQSGANMVLNLNGKTIKNKVENIQTDVIIVEPGATLTINGEGTIEAVTGNDGYAIISEGTLIINGGTFKSGVDANNDPNAVVYARGNGQVYVNGGYFPNDNNSKFVLNKKDADRDNTVIKVTGGIFENFNPGNNAAEGEGTNFVAEEYSSVQDGEYYTVVKGEGVTVIADTPEEILASIDTENAVVYIPTGEYKTTQKFSIAKGVTIIGYGASIKNDWSSNAFNKQCNLENVTVKGVNFSNNTTFDMAYANGEVTFVDCTFSHVRGNQSIHFDGKAGAKVKFDNCTFYGRNMYAASLDKVIFNDCKFKESTWNTEQGNKGVATGWSGINMWGKYEFNRCEFEAAIHCQVKTDNVTATFNGCKYNESTDLEGLVRFSSDVDETTCEIEIN